MKRYLVFVVVVFLSEVLTLALLQDRQALASFMPERDEALTYAFWLAWPLGLTLLLFRHFRNQRTGKSSARKRKPTKRKTTPRKQKKGMPL